MNQCANVNKAVILASGYGRRMRRKDGDPSKPMTKICGIPLISYVIDLLIWSGVEKIYIVYHSITADILNLTAYKGSYEKYLEFIREDEQKGTLLTFSRAKDLLTPPFLMVFEDIIATKRDFLDMLSIGRQYMTGKADLVIQTVDSPSILSERAFLTEKERIVRYEKDGLTENGTCMQAGKYGGMVYLWLNDPFPLIETHLLKQNYKFSAFLEQYIPKHLVYEMPIRDMWDVDTPETILLTKEILEKRGSWNGCFK